MPEPDFFDLDAQPEPSETAHDHTEHTPEAAFGDGSERQAPVGPSAILDRAANFGKAVMTVVKEERDEKLDRLKDATRFLPSPLPSAKPGPDQLVSPDKAADLLQDDEDVEPTELAPQVVYGKGDVLCLSVEDSLTLGVYRGCR